MHRIPERGPAPVVAGLEARGWTPEGAALLVDNWPTEAQRITAPASPAHPAPAGPTTVYRLYDGAGRLLYVGVALEPTVRLRGHRRTTWWPQVRRIELQPFDTRPEALAEEAAAIVAEAPLHNRAGRP